MKTLSTKTSLLPKHPLNLKPLRRFFSVFIKDTPVFICHFEYFLIIFESHPHSLGLELEIS